MSLTTGVYHVHNLYNNFTLWLQEGIVGTPLVVASPNTDTGDSDIKWDIIRQENGSFVVQHNASSLYAYSFYNHFDTAVVAAGTEHLFTIRQVSDEEKYNIGAAGSDVHWNEQAFTSLRVYAIIGRKWNLALLALLAGLVPAAANLYFYATNSYAQMVYVADTIAVCSYTSGISAQVFQRSMYIDSRYYVTVALMIFAAAAIALRCCAIFSDAIAIAVTWSHTWSWRRSASESSQKPTLTAVMLRDGSGYFIVLVIISVLKLVTETEIIHNERWSQDGNYITIFLPSVTGILISRFMFNLRHQSDAQWKTNTDSVLPSDVDTQSNYPSDTHFVQSIQFAPKLVGNMSASLTFGASDTLLDDDDELEDVGCNESDTADTEEKGGDELPDGGESGHLEIVEVTRIP
ncbi:hypothetical protein WOLCODRAFT_166974 [Wolfiporia cocos MD-104 SS10]|uniref:Transmembrane protein n=1 Tax=Wolfiporia cocos (strain MD-104) TaxID=742152 RepID=A0A2H3J2N3_WOLCO|nr:hypothetical protein WOLCODRAFT_166974 [Wolfiporia cocos MD-104 SS10]